VRLQQTLTEEKGMGKDKINCLYTVPIRGKVDTKKKPGKQKKNTLTSPVHIRGIPRETLAEAVAAQDEPGVVVTRASPLPWSVIVADVGAASLVSVIAKVDCCGS
jgi:hypothetical protein